MKRALVTGGTGYVGCHLVDALARRSVEVVVAARKNTPREAVEFVRSRGATVREVDYGPDAGLSAEFGTSDVWFHLIGSIQRLRSDPFEHRHRDLTAQLVTQARQGRIERVVFLSALGAAADAQNAYHRTKWEAEREIVESAIAGAIVRPSLIVGRAVGPRNSKLVDRYIRMIRKGKVFVLGDGSNLIQPLDVRDLVRCMVLAAEKDNSGVAIYDLGGREQIQFREFITRLASAVDRGDVPMTRLPLWIAALLARVLEVVQERPILTREQVALVRRDNICAVDCIESRFGFKPRSLDTSLETYREAAR